MSWADPDLHDEELFNSLALDSNLGCLCLALSPAPRIEPLLLRNTRLRYCPKSDASLENAFWYSDYISSRSARAVTLYPGLARKLLEYANAQSESASDYIHHVERLTQHWSELERIEQDLRFVSFDPDRHSENITELYQKLLKYAYTLHLKRTDASKPHDEEFELARRLKGILPTFTGVLPDREENSWLRQYAGALLGDFSGDLVNEKITMVAAPTWINNLFPREEVTRIRLQLFPGQLYCLSEDAEEGMLLGLSYPLPAPVMLSYKNSGQTIKKWAHLRPNGSVTLHTAIQELRITTLTGQTYLEIGRAHV